MSEKQCFKLNQEAVRDLDESELDQATGGADLEAGKRFPQLFLPPGGVPRILVKDLGLWGFK